MLHVYANKCTSLARMSCLYEFLNCQLRKCKTLLLIRQCLRDTGELSASGPVSKSPIVYSLGFISRRVCFVNKKTNWEIFSSKSRTLGLLERR